jgi:hypothetical protein
MDKKMEQNYNDIVGKTMINLFTISSDKDGIFFDKIDIKNKEHLYALYVAMMSSGVFSKGIRFNMPRRARKKIAKTFNCATIEWKKRAKKKDCVVVDELLDFMRPYCEEKTGIKPFDFGAIYTEFYEGRYNESN